MYNLLHTVTTINSIFLLHKKKFSIIIIIIIYYLLLLYDVKLYIKSYSILNQKNVQHEIFSCSKFEEFRQQFC